MFNIAPKMLQESVEKSGLVERDYPPMSSVTSARLAEELRIKQSKVPKDTAGQIMLANLPMLRVYIQRKGEVPFKDPAASITQAVLLRANDVAYIAASIDSDDLSGLTTLEDNEAEYMDIQNAESEYILPPDVQASMKVLMEYMKTLAGGKDLKEVMQYVRGESKASNFHVFDLIGNVMQDNPLYNEAYYKDQAFDMYPEKAMNNFNNADTPDSFAFMQGLFNAIDNGTNVLTSGIDKVKDKVQSVIDKMFSSAAKQSIKDNLPIIIGIILLLGLTIYFAVRYGKSSSK